MDNVSIGNQVRLSGVIVDKGVTVEDEVIAANSKLMGGTCLHL